MSAGQAGGDLSGITVALLRSPDRGAEMAGELAGRGAETLLVPLIDSELPADTGELDRLLDAVSCYDWLVVTSVTTVRVLAMRAGVRKIPLSSLIGSARVAAVGAATGAALTELGVTVELTPEDDQSAEGLLAGMPSEPASALLPQSDLAADTLRAGLAERGWAVDAVTAYVTVDYPAAPERRVGSGQPTSAAGTVTREELLDGLRQGRIDAVVLTSPSIAVRLHAMMEALPDTVATVAIGRRTERDSSALGIRIDATAASPSPAGIADAVSTAVANHRKRNQRMSFPQHRPRRLRSTPAIRRMTAENRLSPAELILPAFIREGLAEPVAINSMPGVVQHSTDTLRRAAAEAADLGIGGIMLFGIPAHRDATGSAGIDPDGVLNRAIADVRAEVGDSLVLMSDVCLDEFTDHGHCGVLAADGKVDNDATLELYAQMAVAQANAGAHVLGPSGMMDGQVGVIRRALDAAGHQDTAVLAYAAKYASAFYGPFREAVDSQLTGDRRTYQMDAANRREALLEVQLDLEEGADMVMVKPAMSYLDIVADVAAMSPVPVAAYQISGEYAMIEAAAANGWIDRRRSIEESVLGIKRAGAQIILTYWATELATWLKESK